MSKSIQDKLKASVKASLAKANQPKKHDMTTEEVMTSIGIPKSTSRPKDICVYKIKYHNRARLDHVKYPNERMRSLPDSPIFATHADGDKWCRKKEKEDPENLYFTRMTWVPEPEVPKAVLKKIKERGW